MQTPDLYGLILVGGQSKRMGTDKALLTYHHLPQHIYLAELLKPFCSEVYLSISTKQLGVFGHDKVIVDVYESAGPMGALLSAFGTFDHVAWLVVACDMPFLTAETLACLCKNRNPSAPATAFENPITHSPEPLISIYEPHIYEQLGWCFHNQRMSSLKKTLQHQDLALVKCPNERWLVNVNTQAAFAAVNLPSEPKKTD